MLIVHKANTISIADELNNPYAWAHVQSPSVYSRHIAKAPPPESCVLKLPIASAFSTPPAHASHTQAVTQSFQKLRSIGRFRNLLPLSSGQLNRSPKLQLHSNSTYRIECGITRVTHKSITQPTTRPPTRAQG